jgi:hypothetical protein
VQVYDYVDNYVLMLSSMYGRRLKGYAAIGYVIEQETTPPSPSWVHIRRFGPASVRASSGVQHNDRVVLIQ